MTPDREFIASRLDPISAWTDWEGLEGRAAAAVLAPLIDRPSGWHVILTLRPTRLRRHAGQIAFPGGRVDPGETPWQTALREAQEEIALEPALVQLAGLLRPQQAGLDFTVTPVVGFVDPAFQPMPNPDEVEEVFEVPFAFLMDAANHKTHVWTTPDGVERRGHAMPYEDRFIWGATAGMLKQLHGRLYG